MRTRTSYRRPAKAASERAAPPRFSPAQLAERTLHRRAIEAAIWGMPVVNFERMYREFERTLQGGSNQILYWSRLLDWRNQTLTPNPDVIYLMPFFDTTDGPVVLEVPPADEGLFNGSVMNRWQAAIEDIGPGGVDEGKGGRYAVLPPGYDPAELPRGYIPMPSDTFQGYALVRSILQEGGDQGLARAVAYAKRLALYPLAEAGRPSPTRFVDASDVVFDSTIPYDLRFYDSLDRMVQAEPWLERDRAMIDTLKTIGIERGRAFAPDARTREILEDAIAEAHALLDARYDDFPPFFGRGHWFFPVGKELDSSVKSFFQTPDSYPLDARASLYTFAFFSARHAGESQFYLLADRDAAGEPLDGGASYRVRVPAHVPVTQYWSLTVYDRATHAFIRELPRQGRSSQSPGLRTNADGSVDLHFGPHTHARAEANWIPTVAGGRFEVLARFYGPTKALYDQSWVLPDLERE